MGDYKIKAWRECGLLREPLPWVGADFVISRWLDPYVDDLATVVGHELRCLKSGGRIVHFGTFNWATVAIRPPSELFDRVAQGIAALYEQRGRRIDATGMIPALACAQGATIVRIRNESPVARPKEPLWDWYRQFSCSMLLRVVEAGLLAGHVPDSYDALWTQYGEMRSAFLSVPAQLLVIAEKH